MKKNITIRSNRLDISQKIKTIITKKFSEYGYNVSEEFTDKTSLVISIGGDGSFLRAARELDFPDVPFFCINTGHLGFFAEILPDEKEIDYFIDSYMNNEFEINELPLLEIDIENSVHSVRDYAINELVVRGNRSRTAHLNLFVNGNFMETFSGDGLILSTSTGSTAYNYSAGGSIVDNRLKIMQITPISPISSNAFRSFTSSIILPAEDSEISINPEYKFDNSILIVIDGEEKKYQNISKIKSRQASKRIKLLRLRDYEFWNRVYMKFLKTYDYKENERKSF
ncbi:inorganic polyphosphate kinase [Peptostreptococcus russellii]|uniref:NAD kinase n=1 Tax=Peptostreptococcus russellii TaxID=215200 RepID=A0A2P7Q0E4_9FIRM|nr:NAD(+)/NADH kinase [Peptostreptococcus russellii]PSJ31432.1 inorganic polyphosphate kinase [Peptostreptococcus russellii]